MYVYLFIYTVISKIIFMYRCRFVETRAFSSIYAMMSQIFISEVTFVFVYYGDFDLRVELNSLEINCLFMFLDA